MLLLAVCSTTLWVGQVDKKATQQDLTNLFEEFGQIESINVSVHIIIHFKDFKQLKHTYASGFLFSLSLCLGD